jgi:hypothetical protein
MRHGMRQVRIEPGDTYSAHLGGSGDAGTVSATVTVHLPTDRLVDEWISESTVILGASVGEMRRRGYSVAAYAR